MNNLALKPLNTMEQAIYTRVQSHLKIAYDKEQLQKDCEIKSKIWVTRSVNALIKLGFIQEIKDEQSMESFLVLSSFDDKNSEEETALPVLDLTLFEPFDKNSSEVTQPIISSDLVVSTHVDESNKTNLALNEKKQQILNFFYEQTQEGTKPTNYIVRDIAAKTNLSKVSVRQQIRLLKKMQLMSGVDSDSRVKLTHLGAQQVNPNFVEPPQTRLEKEIESNGKSLHLDQLPSHITRIERQLLATLILLKEDYPWVDLELLRHFLGIKKENFATSLIRLAKEKLITYSYRLGVIGLLLDSSPETGTYQAFAQNKANAYKKKAPLTILHQESEPTLLSEAQYLFLNHYEKLSESEIRMLNFLIQLHLQAKVKWIKIDAFRLVLSFSKEIVHNYLRKLAKIELIEFDNKQSAFCLTGDQTTLQSFYEIIPPLALREELFHRIVRLCGIEETFNPSTDIPKAKSKTHHLKVISNSTTSHSAPLTCLIPASTYEARVFLIDTENVGVPFCEQLKEVLTEKDTIILMLSPHSASRSIPTHLLHLVLNAPWQTKSFEVPIFQTKNDALDHALVSELTIQLLEHRNHQFFILSKDQGFLSAIHHLKDRLALNEDQVQLLPSFYEKA